MSKKKDKILFSPIAAFLDDGSSVLIPDDLILADCKGCPSVFEACMCLHHNVGHKPGTYVIEGYVGNVLKRGCFVKFGILGIVATEEYEITEDGPAPAFHDN